MTILTITDLNESKELDTRALTAIRGGFAYQPDYYLRKPAYFGGSSTDIKTLFNDNTQLNIAVLSKDIFQANSNTVSQF